MNAIEEIEKLAKLRDRGVLTEEEFRDLKAYTLSSEDSQPPAKGESCKNAIKSEPYTIISTHSVEPQTKGLNQTIEKNQADRRHQT